MEAENPELIEGDLPSRYVVIRKDDGVFALLKMEPNDEENINEEIIDETEQDMELEEAEDVHDEEEDTASQREYVSARYLSLHDEQSLVEIDIDDIPDIIEEQLSPRSFAHTESGAEVSFIEEADYVGAPVQKRSLEQSEPKISRSQVWKGVTIPANMTASEIKRFKAEHLLQRLAEQVRRNRQKVEIYGSKNVSLRKLISNQRLKMIKLGFQPRDIARFHNVAERKREDSPPPLSPKVEKGSMTEMELIEYETKRFEAEYLHLRRKLKSLLASHRRYKKVFVDNHEKIGNGPKAGMEFIKRQCEAQLLQLESDGEEPDQSSRSVYKCFYCDYPATSKSKIRTHVKSHLPKREFNCPVCVYSADGITAFIAHMRAHPGAKAFTCDHCDFKTAHPSALRNHRARHLTTKPFKCPECKYRTVRSDHLRNHMNKHGTERKYKCQYCTFSSKFMSGLSKHKKEAHKKLWRQHKKELARRKEEQQHSRIGALQVAVAEEDLEEEEEEDSDLETTEIEIDESGRMTLIRSGRRGSLAFEADRRDRKSSLRQRAKKKEMADFIDGEEFDEGDSPAEDADDYELIEELEEADPVTTQEMGGYIEDVGEDDDDDEEDDDDLRAQDDAVLVADPGCDEEEPQDEEEDEEIEEDDYKPNDIEDDYKEPLAMMESIKQKPGKDLLNSYVIYQCVFCDYSCEMKTNLLHHVRTHLDMWKLSCKLCEFVAQSPVDLKTHTEDHKNEGENTCSYCDHVASNKDRLKRHMEKKHPPGMPLACTHCDYISSNRLAMRNHVRGHRKTKTWQCLVCNYKAPFRSSLKRHLRKHTGERPYHCPHCEFNAAQYSHLTRHLRKFHPDESLCHGMRAQSPFLALQ